MLGDIVELDTPVNLPFWNVTVVRASVAVAQLNMVRGPRWATISLAEPYIWLTAEQS